MCPLLANVTTVALIARVAVALKTWQPQPLWLGFAAPKMPTRIFNCLCLLVDEKPVVPSSDPGHNPPIYRKEIVAHIPAVGERHFGPCGVTLIREVTPTKREGGERRSGALGMHMRLPADIGIEACEVQKSCVQIRSVKTHHLELQRHAEPVSQQLVWATVKNGKSYRPRGPPTDRSSAMQTDPVVLQKGEGKGQAVAEP